MTTDTNPDVQLNQTDCHVVSDDLMCLSCGYNLKSLAYDGECPECGHSIRETAMARNGATKRDAAILAFRIVALCSFLMVATTVAATAYISADNIIKDLFLLLVFMGMSAVLPTIVWLASPWLATKAIRHDGPISFHGPPLLDTGMIIACSVIGLIYLVSGVRGAVWIIITCFRTASLDVLPDPAISIGLNLLIGIVLISRASQIVNFVLWLRTAGTSKGDRQP